MSKAKTAKRSEAVKDVGTPPFPDQNGTLYHRMSAPRTESEIRASVFDFSRELYALREKHKIRECFVVIACSTEGGDAVATMHVGDVAQSMGLAIAGVKWARASLDDMIAEAVGVPR